MLIQTVPARYGTQLYDHRFILFLLVSFMTLSGVMAQESNTSMLYRALKERDSLLFDAGFNNCDLHQFERLVNDDFEFYHDQAGVISSRAAFISSIKDNVCGLDYKARRVLTEGSLEVYPLREHGILYGAIQTGIHRFYALEKDKPEYLTSTAKFTHVWKLQDKEWKLLRGLSYDHHSADMPGPPDFDDAEQVNAWISLYNVPALGIGLIRNGQLQDIRIYGALNKGRPASYNSIFNVASITKIITTMLTLKLVSAGQWSLDDPLYHYWTDPDVQADPRSKRITTRHILNQRSGFPNWRRELPGHKLAFQFAPGSEYRYSGEGFEYLRRALESRFHKSLDQMAGELVFKPLGMTDTRYTWDKGMDSLRFAVPHDAQGNALPIDKNTTANAADLVTTTIADLGRFLVAAMNGEGLSEDIAAAMVSREVKTKEDRYIGLGWFIYDHLGNGEYAIAHGGDDRGAHSIFFLLPRSRQGIIIFTNSDNGPKLYADLLRAFLKEKGQAIVDIEMK